MNKKMKYGLLLPVTALLFGLLACQGPVGSTGEDLPLLPDGDLTKADVIWKSSSFQPQRLADGQWTPGGLCSDEQYVHWVDMLQPVDGEETPRVRLMQANKWTGEVRELADHMLMPFMFSPGQPTLTSDGQHVYWIAVAGEPGTPEGKFSISRVSTAGGEVEVIYGVDADQVGPDTFSPTLLAVDRQHVYFVGLSIDTTSNIMPISSAKVFRMVKQAGAVPQVMADMEGGSGITGLVQDQDHLYMVDVAPKPLSETKTSVMRIVKLGKQADRASPTTVVDWTFSEGDADFNMDQMAWMQVNDGHVYWKGYYTGAIQRASLNPAAGETSPVEDLEFPGLPGQDMAGFRPMTVAGKRIYINHRFQRQDRAGLEVYDAISMLPLEGGQPELIVVSKDKQFSTSLAVDTTHLYWAATPPFDFDQQEPPPAGQAEVWGYRLASTQKCSSDDMCASHEVCNADYHECLLR